VTDAAAAQALTDRLTKTERERRWPTIRPKDAATLIILERREGEPRVLMGRRHAGHRFMPGKFVFPGGRIETGDRGASAVGALSARAAEALMARTRRPSPARGRALALAAIRETFEETGLLLGTAGGGAPGRTIAGPWAAFAERGILPNLDAMQFVARAITPPRRPKRFDTRFFTIDRDAIAGEVGGVVGPQAELTELAWVSLSEARRLDLPTITGVILDELEARLANGFAPELPVPFYYERRGRFVRDVL
jgi:8-oxo-dGTP pyrophosphatase MutT (NUDIX family)